ncbi:MAG: hypothetical protein ACKO2Z_26950, partial [Sphaerospermopsis kisseleviana]
MDKIQVEIKELNSQIQALLRERAALTQNSIESSENNTNLAIVEAYRRQARENPEIAAEIQGIDNAIAFLEKQKQQKQAQLNGSLTFSKRLAQQQQE